MAYLRVSVMAKEPVMDVNSKEIGYVALLLPELRTGGAQKVFLTLAKEFIARGLQVDLVLLMKEGELLAEIPEGVQLIVLGQQPLSIGCGSLFRKMVNLVIYLRRNRPNVLLSTLTGTNILSIIASVFSRISFRLVIREASPLINLRYSILRFIMCILYRKANLVIVPSDRMKRELLTKLRLPNDKVIKIGNPLDIDKIERESKKNLPDDFDCSLPYVLSVGRLAPPKDFVTLLEAFAKLKNNGQMRLVILGEGPDRPFLEALARKLSVEAYVELRGYDTNPYRWMRRASVMVLSSHWEGCPNVVIEAQSLGTPIIISQYDISVSEFVGRENKVFPVGDVETLTKILEEETENRKSRIVPSPHDISLEYMEALGYGL